MHPATLKLQQELIRHLKGLLTAWTQWLQERYAQTATK